MHDFFKMFLGSRLLWTRFFLWWVLFQPIVLCFKDAVITPHIIPAVILVSYITVLYAIARYIDFKNPGFFKQYSFPACLGTLNKKELAGYLSFEVIIMGGFAVGLMMCFTFLSYSFTWNSLRDGQYLWVLQFIIFGMILIFIDCSFTLLKTYATPMIYRFVTIPFYACGGILLLYYLYISISF